MFSMEQVNESVELMYSQQNLFQSLKEREREREQQLKYFDQNNEDICAHLSLKRKKFHLSLISTERSLTSSRK